MYPLTYGYAAISSLVHSRLEVLKKNDRGSNTIEYAGLVALVAGIIGAVLALGLKGTISDAISREVTSILGGSGEGGKG